VPPLREEMKLRRNLRTLESLKVDKSVLDVSRVVILGLKQERRRGLQIGLKRRVHIAIGAVKPAGINDHLEIRTGLDGGCRNVLSLKIGMSAEDRSKMRPSREANNADAVRIDMPLGSVSSSETHGLLRVFQVFDIFRKVTLFRHAILHQNTSHTKGVEPIANLCSLKIVGKPDITSARKNKRSSAIVLRWIRRVDRKARFTDVCNANGLTARDNPVGICSRINLRPNHLRGLRVAIGPKEQRLLLGQSWNGKKESKKSGRSHGGIVEQISEIDKWLLDIAPILANSHIGNNGDRELSNMFHLSFNEFPKLFCFLWHNVEEKLVMNLQRHPRLELAIAN
jgi:hypothetical protein